MSYDEFDVDKTMSCDELQDAAMDNLAVEAMTLQAKCDLLKSQLDETAANQGRIQSINAMFIGQISRLMYAFNPEGEKLDPVDPNKTLKVVVGEVIDQAIKAFTEAQIGYELARHVDALTESVRDHQKYQNSIRKAIVDSCLLEGVRDLDSMHLDETVEELIRITRRWISGRDEWMGEAVRNADSAARAEQGRAALEVDANNLRELNTTLAKSLIAVDSMLRDAGIHGPRVEEEHLGENSQLIAIDVAEAISQMKDLSSHLKSLKALKIEPVSMVSEAWDALRRAGVRTEDHATLADAIIHLDQWNNDEIKGDLKRRCEVIDAAWRALNTIEGMKIGEHMSLADAIRWLGDSLAEEDSARVEPRRTADSTFRGSVRIPIATAEVAAESELAGIISQSWLALGAHSFGFEANASLPDAIGKLSRELTKAQNKVEAVRSETHTEFVNGVLTVHTEGATVIIVDHNT